MTALAFKLESKRNIFQDDFARNGASLTGVGFAWLDARRHAAMDAFAKTGVPTRRVEAWKYTDLANALEGDLEPAKAVDENVDIENALGVHADAEILLVNGFFRSAIRGGSVEIVDLGKLDAQTPDWVKDHLGAMAAGGEQPLGAVSLGLMRGGVAVRVSGESTLSLNFAVRGSDRNTISHTRVLIVVEEGASLRLFETHTGQGITQTVANLGMELALKPGAKLEHIRLQAEAANALHVTSLGVTLAKNSEYRALYAAVGARLSRLDIAVNLAAPGAHATLHNVAVLDAGIADVTTVMDHASQHTTSRQLFKSVVGGRGRSVNQGRVSVHKGALKSDSHQLFKALLLSPRAEADAKPELEIFADDVICGHGTAIGALDADALFYLRARGIPEGEAKNLLIRGFLADAIEGFGDEATHDGLAKRLDAAFESLEQL
jgi:Fe-S cluster assembly protein SufD